MPDAPSDRLQDVYEERARLQYAKPVPLPDPSLDRKFERMLELLAGTLPAADLLDAGCGDGRYLVAAASLPGRPERLVGTDIAEAILQTARAMTDAAGLEAQFERANLEALPFPDGSFERVLCVQVIEHLLDPGSGIRELARVLRPGGVLILSTDSSRNRITRTLNFPRTALVGLLHMQGRRRQVEFPHAAFTPDAVTDLIGAAGLEVTHSETFRFHLDPPLDRPATRRLLNGLDRHLPAHGWGDLIAVLARKRL